MGVGRKTVDSVRVDDLSPLPDAAWDAAVRATGRPFRFSHRAVAGRALQAAYPSYRFEPYRATFRDGTVALVPLVRVTRRLRALSMLLGMPLGLEGTPLVVQGRLGTGHVRGLFRALGGRGQLEIHGGAGGSPPTADGAPRAVTHTLDLRVGFEALWNDSFSSRNRNSCRKAQRAGVTVRREQDAAAAASYHALYVAATRSWGYEAPPYPRRLLEGLATSGHAEVWLAELEGRPVAGALMLRGSEDLFYWSGAMNRAFQEHAPSNAVLRAAIESACQDGVSYLDFGASSGLTGVERFKSSFGAQPREFASTELSARTFRWLERGRRRLAGARDRP